ncbi:MAG: type III secretion system chaperone [Desulfovibrionaceae bacterium]|nr:type III secretion system chaperone [Desulfovibrionaceae bacterium]
MYNARDHMNSLLRSLGEKLKLGGLALDDQGAASLKINGETYTLQCYEDGREAYFINRLGFLPSEAGMRAGVTAWLLDRNCFFRGVGPGALGVNQGEDAIWYCARLGLDTLEYDDFEAFLLAVADMSERLRRELAAVPGLETGTAETENTDILLRI